MIYGVDEKLKTALFDEAPASDTIWIGALHDIGTGRELIPIRFGNQDFWVAFLSPHEEMGDDEGLQQMALGFAGGYEAHQNSRLVKFARTEATDDTRYKPDDWPLANPRQIFQFGVLIGDTVAFHAQALQPPCMEYYFWPATDRLEQLYLRIFRYVNSDACLPGEFTPILEEKGVFSGYKRTQN